MTRCKFKTVNVSVTLVVYTAIYVRLMQGMYGTWNPRAMLLGPYVNY